MHRKGNGEGRRGGKRRGEGREGEGRGGLRDRKQPGAAVLASARVEFKAPIALENTK